MFLSLAAAAIFVPAVLLCCRLCAPLFAKICQPRVVAEMVLGIAIGGAVAQASGTAGISSAFAHLKPVLHWLSEPALWAYMFCLGFETDLGRLRSGARTALAIAVTALIVPFCATFAIVAFGVPWAAEAGSSSPVAAVAVSGAMAVTALPVMFRIVEDLNLLKSRVGMVALTAAAIDDLFSWTVLAILIAVTNRAVTASSMLQFAAVTVLCIAGIAGGRYVLARNAAAAVGSRARFATVVLTIAMIVLALLPPALARIDPVLLAFVGGLLVPRAESIKRHIEMLRSCAVALLPLFFVVTGMNAGNITSLALPAIAFWTAWACVTKGGSSYLAALANGFGRRRATIVGALMNCRGVASLIFLSVGLRYGLITNATYSVLLVVALITTVIGTPLILLSEGIARRRLARVPDHDLGLPIAVNMAWEDRA
ncbi:MAG TPA: cation:proton antiporter [Candidatus Elarobacter sp.]|nr:cation:proton antiporter [Candidatus Elarobacter sp.]